MESTSTEKPYTNRLNYRLRQMLGKSLAVLTFDILPAPNFTIPLLIQAYKNVSTPINCIDDSYKILSTTDEGYFVEEEIALPIDKLVEGLKTTHKIIERHSHQGFRMVAIILVRFAAKDASG